MALDYSRYEPLVVSQPSLETFQSPPYRRFLCDAAIASGVRLLLARSRLRPDWPYIDTKFNPNTGRDLPAASYQTVFTWFLGRGSQALDGHLGWLDRLEDLSDAEKAEARDLFTRLIARMTDDILLLVERNNGRCPFRANRDLQAINDKGERIECDPDRTSAGDLFCAKGLIASGDDAKIRKGVAMLTRAADCVRGNLYDLDQYKQQPRNASHGAKMLFQDAVQLTYAKTADAGLRQQIAETAMQLLAFVLDYHYDPRTAVFSEFIDIQTKQKQSYLDPGHAAELVGLGLGALAAIRTDEAGLTDARRALIARADREMPRLLVKDIEIGFNARHPGLLKAIDPATRKPIIDEMPWWNLPEAMRAAVRACEVCDDEAQRQTLLEILARCHNAYFQFYPNRAKMLFPYQTLSGETGKVIDVVPAVPEGDPLYHTNLALLETMEVLETL